MKKIIALSLALLLTTQSAFALETKAKQAFLIDATTQSVLLNKEGDVAMHPSSMSKLMTIYMLFSRLKEGRIKLDSKFVVSEKAWRTQGSKTFVSIGGEMTVEDLIHGIIIQSGNDACIVAAEGISGSEEAFVKEMNEVAKKIGLEKSLFMNASGLPDDNHLMSPRDLATLAQRLLVDFPDYYHYFAIPQYTYHNITQHNRNRLLARNIGVDGLKTGHTEAAGYGITLSAVQGDRRLILVINGLDSDNDRVAEGDTLLRWGFREFQNVNLVRKGQTVGEADVWFGKQASVPLITDGDIVMTLPAGTKMEGVSFTLKYNGPIAAPVAKGAHIADLVVKTPEGEPRIIPLLANDNVEKLTGFSRIIPSLKYYLHR
jgi:serine-type D-Ala-D-Ala carboxypeptidase (penicillin-binding protein 5/6)